MHLDKIEDIVMNLCCPHTRTRLFNWITILLVTSWVGLVTLVAEYSMPIADTTEAAAFVEELVR